MRGSHGLPGQELAVVATFKPRELSGRHKKGDGPPVEHQLDAVKSNFLSFFYNRCNNGCRLGNDWAIPAEEMSDSEGGNCALTGDSFEFELNEHSMRREILVILQKNDEEASGR